jgi:hypothetical protein
MGLLIQDIMPVFVLKVKKKLGLPDDLYVDAGFGHPVGDR